VRGNGLPTPRRTRRVSERTLEAAVKVVVRSDGTLANGRYAGCGTVQREPSFLESAYCHRSYLPPIACDAHEYTLPSGQSLFAPRRTPTSACLSTRRARTCPSASRKARVFGTRRVPKRVPSMECIQRRPSGAVFYHPEVCQRIRVATGVFIRGLPTNRRSPGRST
jgi:hypothetical protein